MLAYDTFCRVRCTGCGSELECWLPQDPRAICVELEAFGWQVVGHNSFSKVLCSNCRADASEEES